MARNEPLDQHQEAGERSLRVAHRWSPTRSRAQGSWLRPILQGLDAFGALLAWTFVVLFGSTVTNGTLGEGAIIIGAASGAALLAIGAQRLYQSRVSAVRAVEVIRLFRSSVISAIVAYIVAREVSLPITIGVAVFGGATCFILLAGVRSLYDGWLKSARASGRFGRPVVIIGSNDEGFELARLLETHPEAGFRAVGVIGRQDQVGSWRQNLPWLGNLDAAVEAIRESGANGVVVAASAIPPNQLNALTRELLEQGVHVHLSSGLHGFASRRIRMLPLANEPLFYLEPIQLARWQVVVKRVLDIMIGSIVLLVSLPVLLAAAIAIRLEDHGPVFFKQERVGRDGKLFPVLKLRTMRPGAEALLDDLLEQNQRGEGPLFKLRQDPRRTRVGRLLERTSLDELPQIINVLRGEMSLVGPRPALPREAEQFDEELLGRLGVPPGVTGLWQVEARDNPSFHAYRRLDLFYVENWSVTLDLAIMLATVKSLIVRVFHRT